MSYIESVLQPDEDVLVAGRMHWIVYARGLILAAAGLALFFWFSSEGDWMWRVAGALVLAVGFINLAAAWFEKWTTEIAVTNFRVIQKRGFIRRTTGEMNMQKVESVIVDQTILGRLLNYGSLEIRGTGSGIEGLRFIANPLALRSAIVAR